MKIGDSSSIDIYDNKYQLVANKSTFNGVEFRDKEVSFDLIGHKSFIDRKRFLEFLSSIPDGCFAIGKLLKYIVTSIGLLPSDDGHCVVIGKSTNKNPYLIESTTTAGHVKQSIHRGFDEIFEYFTTGNYLLVSYLINDSLRCGTIDDYVVTKDKEPAFDEGALERYTSITDALLKKIKKKSKRKKPRKKSRKNSRKSSCKRKKIPKTHKKKQI